MPAAPVATFSILVVVFPHYNLAATSAFIDPFRAANYLGGHTHFHWEVVSLPGGAVVASNAMATETKALGEVPGVPDLVMLSSSWNPETLHSPALGAALRKWARSGVTLGALDTGVYLLAEAGLLDGKRATGHYEHIDSLKELYPAVDIREDMLVMDGKRITCCGGAASTDCALHIIRSLHGDTLANETARYLFHERLRPLGTQQNPEAPQPLGNTVPDLVKQAIRLMEQNLEEALPIPTLCERIGISQRQLDRLFNQIVQKSPALYYRDIRLDRARCLVTQTDMSLMEIAVASGFPNQSHFSRIYRERFGLTPRRDRLDGRIPFEFRAWPMHQVTP
ncbi:GlxA family transcriptional regulator [Pseudomonas citronellolis]|uniref:GlxA family transcriptional regulator n=1 Tax=Pseudomonas citronellolis TaxID=53408 RepID=UPI0023E3B3B1|nr:GlxA family transcriptional regulator [Pseudomonas citronellolis]MDF3933664.1 GlxA family transcriptional regulator [Pseudomonas citronellolis]